MWLRLRPSPTRLHAYITFTYKSCVECQIKCCLTHDLFYSCNKSLAVSRIWVLRVVLGVQPDRDRLTPKPLGTPANSLPVDSTRPHLTPTPSTPLGTHVTASSQTIPQYIYQWTQALWIQWSPTLHYTTQSDGAQQQSSASQPRKKKEGACSESRYVGRKFKFALPIKISTLCLV